MLSSKDFHYTNFFKVNTDSTQQITNALDTRSVPNRADRRPDKQEQAKPTTQRTLDSNSAMHVVLA